MPCKYASTRVPTELGRGRSSCYTELRSRISQFKKLSVRPLGLGVAQKGKGGTKMVTAEKIGELVKTRYGKFAETGGRKEAC